jgi:hypothetical protein
LKHVRYWCRGWGLILQGVGCVALWLLCLAAFPITLPYLVGKTADPDFDDDDVFPRIFDP